MSNRVEGSYVANEETALLVKQKKQADRIPEWIQLYSSTCMSSLSTIIINIFYHHAQLGGITKEKHHHYQGTAWMLIIILPITK
jgi:hypothetical protein